MFNTYENQKNLERLSGIMQYVEAHYTEEITQYEVAERFYFTKEYFSRFFKKNTGGCRINLVSATAPFL